MSRSSTRILITAAAAVLVAFLGAFLVARATSANQTPYATSQFPSVVNPSGQQAPNQQASSLSGGPVAGAIPANQELIGNVLSVDQAHSAFALHAIDGRSLSVVVTAQTEFDDGLAGLTSLQSGTSVQVEGLQQTDGSIVADKLAIPDPSTDGPQQEQLTGSVVSVDQGRSLLSLRTPDGHTFTVAVTAQTQLDDTLPSLGTLQSGATVEVDGAPQADGSILAGQLSIPN